ncbi:hypothetical protein, partial [Streptomyces sp. NPDC055366]
AGSGGGALSAAGAPRQGRGELCGQPPTGRTRRATAGGSRVCGLWGLLAQYPAPLTGRPGS